MRTKQSRSPKTSEAEILPNPAPGAPSEPVDDISRLAIAVDANGNVQWDRMREKTKDQLKTILQNPDTKKALGLDTVSKVEPVEVFDPEWTGSLYDAIGKLESFGAQKLYHIPPDIAEQAFTYTEKEKEKLGPLTAKVINKYASVWMVQFKDEIGLAFLFVTMTAVKLQMATMLSKMRGAVDNAPAPSRPAVVPTPKDLEPNNLERSVGEETPGA